MKIVSTTLTGNCQDIIGDALRSIVDQVDACLVIDTGVKDATLGVAGNICAEKLIIRRFPWRNDFSAARNFALREAEELKFDWCITVDTDERMIFPENLDLRAELAKISEKVLLCSQTDGSYSKERIFKLPAEVRWRGLTHEGLRGSPKGALIRGMTFSELPKTKEQCDFKNARDVELLRETLKTDNSPRWWFHLGTSLHGLKLHDEAIDAYMACAEQKGWNEESSWACYMAAQCYCETDRFPQAVRAALLGHALRPQTMELPWLASYAAYRAGEFATAIALANLALSIPPDPLRIGFKNTLAQNEGALEVLYFAHQSLGHTEEARHARQAYAERKAARLGITVDRLEGEAA